MGEEKDKRPVGRPSEYDSGIGAIICKGIVQGVGLRKICDPDHMPDVMTLYRWLTKHREFRELYASARYLQAELDIDEIVDIAENKNGDIEEIEFETKFGKEYRPVFMRAKLERDKLRIETRKTRMAVMAPHKYGTRIRQEQVGNPEQEQLAHDMSQEQKLEAVKKIWAMAEVMQLEDPANGDPG